MKTVLVCLMVLWCSAAFAHDDYDTLCRRTVGYTRREAFLDDRPAGGKTKWVKRKN